MGCAAIVGSLSSDCLDNKEVRKSDRKMEEIIPSQLLTREKQEEQISKTENRQIRLLYKEVKKKYT